jgi:hypothetical protein
MWTTLKRKLIIFIMTQIVNFLGKRGLRIAQHNWPDLMVSHLETIDGVREIIMGHLGLSTFRVKHPKEHARLINLLVAMQEEARDVTMALNPPLHVQDEGPLDTA